MAINRLLCMLALLVAAGVAHADATQQLPPPIQAMQTQGVEIIGRFDAPGKLTGYAGLRNGEPMAMYLTADGRHAIIGFAMNAAGDYESQSTLETLATGVLTRRLTLGRLDGSAMTLAQFGDQPLVVNIWAAWCPPCRRELPMLAQAQARYRDLTFAFVDLGEEPAVVRTFLDRQALELDNVLIDRDGELAELIGSNEIPITLFYDHGGRLADTHIGVLTAAGLAAILQRLGIATDKSTGSGRGATDGQ